MLSVSHLVRWYEDPRLARQLARLSWLVVAAGFFLTEPGAYGSWSTALALGGMTAVAVVLNFPVALGLYQTRHASASGAWRAVAFGLLARTATCIGVMITRWG